MEDLQLRLLDPATDLDLFRRAYDWRTRKRHISGPQMSFADFSEINPTHLTIGLLNGELLAVYFLREFEPARYEAHFTSRKGVPREMLLAGARQVIDLVLGNGGAEICALVLAANRPLRQFVTELGLQRVGMMRFTSCQNDTEASSIAGKRNHRDVFVKYAATRG